MKLLLILIVGAVVGVQAMEYELKTDDVVDIEVVFPKADNPLNTVPATKEEREKASRLINFLDRLLNRNQGGSSSGATNTNTNTNTNNNNNNNLGSNSNFVATTRRNGGLGSLFFVPDVSKGVDTILGGVATGNLEQIISGSFIFTPNRVQNVANGVINRVFGGPSISTINNQNNQNNLNNQNKNNVGAANNNNNNNLVDALNSINANQNNNNNAGAFPVITSGTQNNLNKQNNNNGNNNNVGTIQGLVNGILGNWLSGSGNGNQAQNPQKLNSNTISPEDQIDIRNINNSIPAKNSSSWWFLEDSLKNSQ